MAFQGPGYPRPPPTHQRPHYRLNFGRSLRKGSVPATPDFNPARARMCARPKRALVIHTLWEVSYFPQFHI
jgi:hypothetical protein